MSSAPAPASALLTASRCSEGVLLRAAVAAPAAGAAPERSPVDLIFVLDVSGSMNAAAVLKGRVEEGVPLSVWQLVGHSVRAVLGCLGAGDRVGLVSFNDTATTTFPLADVHNDTLTNATRVLTAQRCAGRTNLWAGLQAGFEALQPSAGTAQRRSAVFLLTDGMPNVRPLEGELASLRGYLRRNPWARKVALSCFGFAYDLDSALLHDLAVEGGGVFSFIPSPDMVGTSFVNAAANLIAGATGEAVVHVGPAGDASGPELAEFRLGFLQHGRSRDWLVPAAAAPPGALKARLLLQRVGEVVAAADSAEDAVMRLVTEIAVQDSTPDDEREALVQRLRLDTCEALRAAVYAGQVGDLPGAQAAVRALCAKLAGAAVAADPRVVALLADARGEASLAVSREAPFTAWGVHYLRSLARAHEMQMCHNFKDLGVQLYASPAFSAAREAASAIFVALPPPVPGPCAWAGAGVHGGGASSVGLAAGGGGISSSPRPAAAPRNMSRYLDSSGPCFWGTGRVAMADGSLKAVEDICKGDRVLTAQGNTARVSLVVRTLCHPRMRLVFVPSAAAKGAAPLAAESAFARATAAAADATLGSFGARSLPEGLLITEWHPIALPSRGEGSSASWLFPADAAVAAGAATVAGTAAEFSLRGLPCPYIYSFALQADSSSGGVAGYGVIVDGVSTITLAHGVTDDPTLAHPFFGTDRVLQNFAEMRGAAEGLIDLLPGCARTDPATGVICALVQEADGAEPGAATGAAAAFGGVAPPPPACVGALAR